MARGRRIGTREYVDGVLSGDRVLLAQVITLIESNASAHQQQAQKVLAELLPKAGAAIRVGVTGVPGAGKSTLIEVLGCRLTAAGKKVAVLAVDPSSSLTHGSILGDKTRMERLAREENAFIRPSPSGGALGGVARKTRESMLAFEAAGYDVIIVETVGVGQNEITVRDLVDFFLLVLIAGAGDELQGIKRGVIELADAILINKADGDNRAAAELARADHERALHYLQSPTPGWRTDVFSISAREEEGTTELWSLIEDFRTRTEAAGSLAARRKEQSKRWLRAMVEERLLGGFYRHPQVSKLLPELEEAIVEDRLPVTSAAWRLLAAYGHAADAEDAEAPDARVSENNED